MAVHFFGDSIMRGKLSVPCSWYWEKVTGDLVFNYAADGAKVADVAAQVAANSASIASGDTVVINGGINDIAIGRPPSDVASDLLAVVATIEAMAGVECITFPVFPKSTYAAAIEVMNDLLDANATVESDLFNDLSDGEAAPGLYGEYSADGTHLSPSGQRVVAKRIVPPGAIWQFSGNSFSLSTTGTHDNLDEHWRVWPRNGIQIDNGYAYSPAHVGALADVSGLGANFTARAVVSLNRRSSVSFFSFFSAAEYNSALQSGFNYLIDAKCGASNWVSGVSNTILFQDQVFLNAESPNFFDDYQDMEFTLTHYDGRAYLFIEGQSVGDAPITMPNSGLGFWMRDCRVKSFDVTPADVSPCA